MKIVGLLLYPPSLSLEDEVQLCWESHHRHSYFVYPLSTLNSLVLKSVLLYTQFLF
jgi:hypothetical protein